MLQVKDMYVAYIAWLDNRHKKSTIVLEKLNSAIDYVNLQLLKFIPFLESNGYDTRHVLGHCFIKENNSLSISQLPLNGDPVKQEQVKFYLIKKYTLLKRISKAQEIQNSLSGLNIPYNLFQVIISRYNEAMVSLILKGSIYPMGNHLGNMLITRKERVTYIDPSRGTVTRNINWHESKKYREYLISQGIIPYDKETAPDGEKWFVYHNEPYTFWFTWHPSPYMANKRIAKFTPTNFINTETRSHEELVASTYSVDEIINNPYLGNRDKLQVIVKTHPSFGQNYKLITYN